MKIAILGSRGIPANYGGFETFAEYVSVGMAQTDHVSVYCPHYQEYKEKKYKNVNLIFIYCFDNLFKNRVLRAVFNLIYDLLSLIHVCFTRTDIVYMLGYASGPFIMLPRLFGKVVIVNPDGLEWKSKRWGFFARTWLYFCELSSAKLCNGLIADAEPIRDRFLNKFNCNIVYIPYGADLEVYEYKGVFKYDTCEYYLAIARMVPETNINLIIKGFLRSGSTKKLIVIGPIADQFFFNKSIAPLIDNERVFYLGAIYDRALVQKFRLNTMALLHGHGSDGTNPSLLESMALKSPVIAIDTQSNRIVLKENNKLYFNNENNLAEHIIHLESGDPKYRVLLGEQNYEIIKGDYTWSICSNKHLSYFSTFI